MRDWPIPVPRHIWEITHDEYGRLYYDLHTGHVWPVELGPRDPKPTRAEIERAHGEALDEAMLRVAAVAW